MRGQRGSSIMCSRVTKGPGRGKRQKILESKGMSLAPCKVGEDGIQEAGREGASPTPLGCLAEWGTGRGSTPRVLLLCAGGGGRTDEGNREAGAEGRLCRLRGKCRTHHVMTGEALHDRGLVEKLDPLPQTGRLIDRLHRHAGLRLALDDVSGVAFVHHAEGALPQLTQQSDLLPGDLPLVRHIHRTWKHYSSFIYTVSAVDPQPSPTRGPPGKGSLRDSCGPGLVLGTGHRAENRTAVGPCPSWRGQQMLGMETPPVQGPGQ